MTKEKIRETVEYYNTCKECGGEFQVYTQDSARERCGICETNAATGRATEELLPFIGAKVTCLEPVEQGSSTSAGELESIEIETADGKRILFSIAGWEDHYIKWEVKT